MVNNAGIGGWSNVHAGGGDGNGGWTRGRWREVFDVNPFSIGELETELIFSIVFAQLALISTGLPACLGCVDFSRAIERGAAPSATARPEWIRRAHRAYRFDLWAITCDRRVPLRGL